MTRFSLVLSVLAPGLGLSGKAWGFTPPASLPIEPAADDEEVIHKGEAVEIDIERPPQPPPKSEPPPRRSQGSLDTIPGSMAGDSVFSKSPASEKRSSRSILSSSEPGAGDFSAQARLALTSEGFGGAVKLVQYPQSWLGVTETFRYFKNEDDDRLYQSRRGVLIGIELHPFRRYMISPFLDIQGGWENFQRDGGLDDVKSVVGEAAAGVELRLTSFASIVAQWTEAHYPDLREQMFFAGEKKDPKRYQAAEVLFNLKWEKKVF